MRVAVIADVHANVRALEAVVAAVRRSAVDRVVCLGDLVGYNAEPAPCIDLLRDTVDAMVVGNHEVDIVTKEPARGTHSAARRAQDWTREQLDGDRIAYLASLPRTQVDDSGLVMAHGCYLNELYYTGYVTPTMYETNLQAIAERPGAPVVALCGHTHLPACAWLRGDHCVAPETTEPVTWPRSARAVLINPGSVGQPRDGDPRASFAVVDVAARQVSWQRVDYDVHAAARAVVAAGLDPTLAARLEEGR